MEVGNIVRSTGKGVTPHRACGVIIDKNESCLIGLKYLVRFDHGQLKWVSRTCIKKISRIQKFFLTL